MAYSGRGRPPKGTAAYLGGDGGRESSDEEEDPAQSAVAMVMAMEMSDKEYSEEETDEEVCELGIILKWPTYKCVYPAPGT